MGRRAGSRNRDYDVTRHGLASSLAPHLLQPGGDPSSFKDLAAAAGVSESTLKHCFGDREGVLEAAQGRPPDAARSTRC